jgi:putative hydrolase of the HAD superfamily
LVVARELAALGLAAGAPEELFWGTLDRYNAEHALWVKPVDGAAQTLAALAGAGARLGVVSNSDGFCDRYLTRAGLREFLEVIVDSHLVGVEKPDERIFRHALAALDVPADRALFVGDRFDCDVLGAHAVGLRALLYDPEGGPAPEGCQVIHRLVEVIPFAIA